MNLTEDQKIRIIESDANLDVIKVNLNTFTFERRGFWKEGSKFILFPMLGPSVHFSEIEIIEVTQAKYDPDSPKRWDKREKYYGRQGIPIMDENGNFLVDRDSLKSIHFRFIGQPFERENNWCGSEYIYCTLLKEDCLKDCGEKE